MSASEEMTRLYLDEPVHQDGTRALAHRGVRRQVVVAAQVSPLHLQQVRHHVLPNTHTSKRSNNSRSSLIFLHCTKYSYFIKEMKHRHALLVEL